MKTIIQLSADRTKAHWKWQWDEAHPLSALFTPEIVALMVDVTGINPEPQEGWSYGDGVFTAPAAPVPPPPPTMDELLANLEAVKQAYIDLHYPPPAREWMIAYYVNPSATAPGKALITTAWNWVNGSVLPYYFTCQGEIQAGQTPTLDFAQFDATDPAVTVQAVLGAH